MLKRYRLSSHIHLLMLLFVLLIVSVIYLLIYPNPVDWDGMERFNSAIIVHDHLIDYLNGKFGSINELLQSIQHYQSEYRTGVGIIVWPPLQVFLLTLMVFIFGKSMITVFIYSYIVLFLIVFFSYRVLDKINKNQIINIIILLIFFLNPVFLHHIFTLNLRFGEILAFITTLYCIVLYQESNKTKYLYFIPVISVLIMFYRMTGIMAVLPANIALLFIVKDKKKLIGPVLTGIVGALCFLGLHYIQMKLVGLSFMERVTRDYGTFDISGFYFFYQFSDYYRGESSQVVARLAAARYKISHLQKFVYVISSFVFTGLIFFIPWKINLKRTVLKVISLASLILYLIIFTKHGAKPDYLLPLLFIATLLIIMVAIKHNKIITFVAFSIMIGLNLWTTYTRYIHPYYEDVNLTELEKKIDFFDNVKKVYIADTPMKHLAYFSLINNNLFQVVEFSKVPPAKIFQQLKHDEAIILNNEFNYRFQGYHYANQSTNIELNNYVVEKFGSYKSNYVLIKLNR